MTCEIIQFKDIVAAKSDRAKMELAKFKAENDRLRDDCEDVVLCLINQCISDIVDLDACESKELYEACLLALQDAIGDYFELQNL